jgi:hypothetical protein
LPPRHLAGGSSAGTLILSLKAAARSKSISASVVPSEGVSMCASTSYVSKSKRRSYSSDSGTGIFSLQVPVASRAEAQSSDWPPKGKATSAAGRGGRGRRYVLTGEGIVPSGACDLSLAQLGEQRPPALQRAEVRRKLRLQLTRAIWSRASPHRPLVVLAATAYDGSLTCKRTR